MDIFFNRKRQASVTDEEETSSKKPTTEADKAVVVEAAQSDIDVVPLDNVSAAASVDQSEQAESAEQLEQQGEQLVQQPVEQQAESQTEQQAEPQAEEQAEQTEPQAEEQAEQTEPQTEQQIDQEMEQPQQEQKQQPEQEAAAADSSTAVATGAVEGASKVETIVPYSRLVVLHVEVTCDENPTNPAAVQVTKENAEIIQLSFAIVNGSTMEVLSQQTVYVKPERTPLTQFCSQVSGVTSDMVASAGTLKDAINVLQNAIQTEILDKQLDFCFVTHGGWVLRIQLSRETRDKKLELAPYLAQPCMFDLKQEIQRWQVHHTEVHLRTTNIKELCDSFQLPVIRKGDEKNNGDSINDTSNNNNVKKKEDDANIDIIATTVGIVRYLTKFQYRDVFVHPIDTSADLQQFKKEESKVVHLAGLPYEVTQGELEAWFSSNGLRPATMWMMQSNEQTKPSLSGFVVFVQHDDAVRALLLNGRCLSDRVIEVSPSSERVVEAAYSMLSPFPLQAKAVQVRPGDWNCPNCSFHNFASRRHCFKCNAENTSNAGAAPTGPSAPPAPAPSASYSYSAGGHHSFVSGDWNCANPSCGFRNYSSRSQCMKCAAYRPSPSAPPPPSGAQMGYSPHHHAPRPHHPASFRPGDWYCPNPACGFQNFASRMSCYRCHTANPNPTPAPSSTPYGAAAPPPSGAYSGAGGYDNASTSSYGSTGAGGYGSSYGGPPAGNAMAPGTGGHGFRAGDWYCPTCNSHNFASRFQCLKCHTAKPYSASPTPPMYGSPGGFRPNPPMKNGDWVCRANNCGFHNFAKRTYCGKCNTPNPEPSTYGTAEYM